MIVIDELVEIAPSDEGIAGVLHMSWRILPLPIIGRRLHEIACLA